MYKRFVDIIENSGCLAGSKVVVAAADKESI